MHLFLMAALAQAADDAPVRVLVSEFQARNTEAKALASLIENFIASQLSQNTEIQVLRAENLPPFQDYPSRTYLDGCPPGDIVGCTYVAAERGDVEWAVTGTTRVLPGKSTVTVEILDIQSGRVVVSFESELTSGEDEKFAEAVAQMLSSAIGGSMKEQDIRNNGEDDGDMRHMSDDAIAAQLSSLSQELGDLSSVVSQPNSVIQRPDYTMDDLADQMNGEGMKPWERLKMSPGEYLRFKNSGRSLEDWRQLAAGRQYQLLIRPSGGFGSVPASSTYYGRYAFDTGQVVDVYTANAVQNDFGGRAALGLAFGVLPYLDVGLDVGLATGHLTRDYQQQTVGSTSLPADILAFQSKSFFFGPRVTAAFLPVSPVRPLLSGALLIWHGDKVDNHEGPPSDLALFPAPNLVIAEVMVGGEARITHNLDFFIHVPIDLTVGGQTFVEKHEGSADVLNDVVPPEAGGATNASVQFGFQIRLGGKKIETSILDTMEEE